MLWMVHLLACFSMSIFHFLVFGVRLGETNPQQDPPGNQFWDNRFGHLTSSKNAMILKSSIIFTTSHFCVHIEIPLPKRFFLSINGWPKRKGFLPQIGKVVAAMLPGNSLHSTRIKLVADLTIDMHARHRSTECKIHRSISAGYRKKPCPFQGWAWETHFQIESDTCQP